MITRDKLPSYNHLVIIGNGFDLNLGLPTSYNHFIKSDEFQTISLSNKNNLFVELAKTHTIQDWIDVENVIKVLSVRRYGHNREQLKREFKELKLAFSAYLTRTLSAYDINTSSRAYSFMDELNFDDSIIINFNYTTVISQFMINKKFTDTDKRIIHIHGDYKENNLILGVEDGTELHDGHEFLLKSTHLNYSGFNLNRLLKSTHKLSIFGHSLGETDIMYFNDFFTQYSEGEATQPLELDLYYYDENSFDSLMSRINALTNGKTGKFRQNLNFNLISSI